MPPALAALAPGNTPRGARRVGTLERYAPLHGKSPNPMNLVATLISLLLGLFGGAGAIGLWELWLRPKQEGKHVASVLACELELNEERILATQIIRRQHPKNVLRNLHLSDRGLNAYLDRLATLSPDAVRLMLRYYWECDRARTIALTAYDEQRDLANSHDSTQREDLRHKLLESLRLLDERLEEAVRISRDLRRQLYEVAGIPPAKRLANGDLERKAEEYAQRTLSERERIQAS